MKYIPIKLCPGCSRTKPLSIESGLCIACTSLEQLLPRLPVLCVDCNTAMSGREFDRRVCPERLHEKKKA